MEKHRVGKLSFYRNSYCNFKFYSAATLCVAQFRQTSRISLYLRRSNGRQSSLDTHLEHRKNESAYRRVLFRNISCNPGLATSTIDVSSRLCCYGCTSRRISRTKNLLRRFSTSFLCFYRRRGETRSSSPVVLCFCYFESNPLIELLLNNSTRSES